MKDKVLYISPLDHTGYGHAAIDTILAMDSVGVDIVCRPIVLNQFRTPLPNRIEQLLQKSTAGCNIVIQHCLPHQFIYDADFKKCIGLFSSETYGFGDTSWHRYIGMMDEIWTTSDQMTNIVSQHNKNVHKIAFAINLDKFKMPVDSFSTPILQDKFIFYFIGEATRRKNLASLLCAFHSEFSRTEDVALLIKTTVPGMQNQQAAEHMQKYCQEVKLGLKLYRSVQHYIPEVIITEYVNEQQMLQLHKGCDCLVAPSYGDAWNIPAVEAMALGKTPIVTKTGGLGEVITNDVGWVVDATPEPCFGMMNTFEDLYTSTDDWDSINLKHLRQDMREAFSNGILKQKKSLAGIRRGYEFGYDKVGNQLKELLSQ